MIKELHLEWELELEALNAKKRQLRPSCTDHLEKRLSFPWKPLQGDIVVVKESAKLPPKVPRDPESGPPLTSEYFAFQHHRSVRQTISMFVPVVVLCLLIFAYVQCIAAPLAKQQTPLFQRILPYAENGSDTSAKVILGSLCNAMIVLGAVVFFTLLYVVLLVVDKRCVLVWTLKGLIAALLCGPCTYFGYQLILLRGLRVDILSFIGCFWNLTVVGIHAVILNDGCGVPLCPLNLNRAFCILLAAAMAWPFAEFPEWSVWMTVIVLGIYDLCAVLSPCGPLKYIMDKEGSSPGMEPLPAMLYRGTYFVLGLGDLVFYGALFCQAARYDGFTTFSCYIGVVAGLALTIIWNAKTGASATPALPLSAVLGTFMYACFPRLVLPMCQQLAASMLML